MLVSTKWLRNHIDLSNISDEEIASKLTFAGVEVEEIKKMASGSNLVIGEIISCKAHPDSSHLHILQVDEGEDGIHQIVCGAPNARKGLKVIVAREGAILPNVTISKSTIRGVESDGMCCSLLELGVEKKMLSEKQVQGIEELPFDAPVGEKNVLNYLGLDDTILDLSLLANRPDLYALENVLKEVSTLFDKPYKLDEIEDFKEEGEPFKASSLTPSCDRFGTYLVKGVKTHPSPKWMVNLLHAEGIRSINNVVDIGNLVMLLTGQPLNMYDADKLPSPELVVRDDIEEEYQAMDDKTYSLKKGDLLVTSSNRGMCLAGIMTSKEAAVTSESVNIVIEAAHFLGAPIRKTSNRLGLSSDSSQRFIKGSNIEAIERALKMAASYLLKYAEATSVSKMYDFRSQKEEAKVIETSLSYINNRLGTSFDLETVIKTLERDHFLVTNEGELLSLKVPSHRLDIGGKADISEEIIRLLGFESIKSTLPKVATTKEGLSEAQKKKASIRTLLSNQGLDEVLTYTLTKKDNIDKFAYLNKGTPVSLLNPLTEDRLYCRLSLLPSLIEVANYNISRQNKNLALFEVSDVDTLDYQGTRLAILLVGKKETRSTLETSLYDFYDIKGLLVSILEQLGILETRYELKPLSSSKEEFHPGRSAALYIGKQLIGVLGEIHPKALKEYDLGKNAVALEIDLGALLDVKVGPIKAKVPSKFPTVTRDLAFIVDKKVDFASIRREIKRSDKLISEVKVFDSYEGENILPGKKSLAITIELAAEKTLVEGEISLTIEKIINLLKIKFLAEVRE